MRRNIRERRWDWSALASVYRHNSFFCGDPCKQELPLDRASLPLRARAGCCGRLSGAVWSSFHCKCPGSMSLWLEGTEGVAGARWLLFV